MREIRRLSSTGVSQKSAMNWSNSAVDTTVQSSSLSRSPFPSWVAPSAGSSPTSNLEALWLTEEDTVISKKFKLDNHTLIQMHTLAAAEANDINDQISALEHQRDVMNDFLRKSQKELRRRGFARDAGTLRWIKKDNLL